MLPEHHSANLVYKTVNYFNGMIAFDTSAAVALVLVNSSRENINVGDSNVVIP